MACLTEESISAFLERALAPEESGAAEEHVATCAQCRQVLAEAARLRSRAGGGGSVEPSVRSPEPLRPGAHVSRYEIRAPIGAGAMGIVYDAWDPQLQRRVALKLLRRLTGDGSEATAERERLSVEAQAMARLSHPNVVAVYDAGVVPGEANGEVFVVMELVEGRTLAAHLAAQRRPWREILDLFAQAGRGLAAVHAANLVHRDFKPHNVLIGRDERARVTDFGLARRPGWASLSAAGAGPAAAAGLRNPGAAIAEDLGADSAGAPSAIAGTPLYMSPEQFRGEPVTSRTDQFSFAVALYWALYLRHPFAGARSEGIAALADRMTSGTFHPAPPDAAVPPAVAAVLGRSLAPRPEDRFLSMEALLDALAAAAAPVTVRRRPPAWLGLPIALVAATAVDRLGFHESCGNTKREGAEECDDGNLRDDDACLPDCRHARCGDGVIRRAVETCDDGNTRDDDGCTSSCVECRAAGAAAWAANGHCYVRDERALPYDAAAAACRDDGGDLATVTSRGEAVFIHGLMRGGADAYWLGVQKSPGADAFELITGEPNRATHLWAPGEPGAVGEAPACGIARASEGSAGGPAAPILITAVPCGEARPFVCERPGWTVRRPDNHAYRLFTAHVQWHAARESCRRVGGHLATILDAAEQDAVATLTPLGFWIGLAQPTARDSFAWVTGEPLGYRNFAIEEPNMPFGSCVTIDRDDHWYDRSCGEIYPFLCEVD